MIVLDCSFVLAMVMPDERRPVGCERVTEGSVIVPPIWSYEVANAFRSAVRRGRVAEAEVIGMCSLLEGWRIAVVSPEDSRVRRTYLSAMARGLSAYDTSYVDLAVQRSAVLATLDQGLADAAREAGVTVMT